MFNFVKSLSGENFQTTATFPTTASETYTDGEALVMASGKLTKAGPTVKPTYIAAAAYVAPASGNKELVVYPVMPHHVFETSFAADASAVAEGVTVTLHTDGGQITATATSGVATIVKKLGTGAVGTMAHVRFI